MQFVISTKSASRVMGQKKKCGSLHSSFNRAIIFVSASTFGRKRKHTFDLENVIADNKRTRQSATFTAGPLAKEKRAMPSKLNAGEQKTLNVHHRNLYRSNLVPRVSRLPAQAREERPWLGLVTCLPESGR